MWWIVAWLALAAPVDDPATQAEALGTEGFDALEAGEPERARPLLEEAVALRRELGEPLALAKVLNNLAKTYADLGDTGRSAELYIESIEAFPAAPKDEEGRQIRQTAARNYAVAMIDLGEYAEAASILGQVMELLDPDDQEGLVRTRELLAVTASRQGRLEQAYTELTEALQAAILYFGAAHARVAHMRMNLGALALRRDKLDQARAELEEAWRIQAPLGDEDLRADIAEALSLVYQRAGGRPRGLELALVAYELRLAELLRLQTEVSSREYLGLLADARGALSEVVESSDDPAQAYTAVLQLIGGQRRLLAARHQAALQTDDPRVRALRAELAELAHARTQATLEQDQDQLDTLRNQSSDVERKLAALLPIEPVDVALSEVCGPLRPDETLVHYVLLHGRTFAFVVSDDCTVRQHDLGDWEAITTDVERLDLLLDQQAPTERIRSVGDRVRAALVDPLALETPWVVVVPDDALASLSFAALPTQSDGFLIEQHRWLVAEDAAHIGRYTPEPRGGDALVVGDVDFGEGTVGDCPVGGLRTLPGTAAEATEVAKWLRRTGAHPTLLTGADANEHAVASSVEGARWIHLATHGVYLAESCLDEVGLDVLSTSGVALADANATGDLWTAREILNVDLRNAQLVTVAACSSGRGLAMPGEGAMGLRRALSVAGARNQLLALWSIPDQATLELMRVFYRQLVRGVSPAEALHRAQLDALARARRRHGDPMPGLWGAFVLSGQLDR